MELEKMEINLLKGLEREIKMSYVEPQVLKLYEMVNKEIAYLKQRIAFLEKKLMEETNGV